MAAWAQVVPGLHCRVPFAWLQFQPDVPACKALASSADIQFLRAPVAHREAVEGLVRVRPVRGERRRAKGKFLKSANYLQNRDK